MPKIERKTKVCPHCEKRKKIEKFPTATRRADGHGPWCKTCANTSQRDWYSRNAKKHKAQTTAARQKRREAGSTYDRDYARQYRENNAGQMRFELSRRRADAVKRAKRKKLPISITLDELEELWVRQEGRCALTGWTMEVRGGGLKDPYCLTIDRIEDTAGYVPGNVRLICWMANKAKSAWGENLFIQMCRDVMAPHG